MLSLLTFSMSSCFTSKPQQKKSFTTVSYEIAPDKAKVYDSLFFKAISEKTKGEQKAAYHTFQKLSSLNPKNPISFYELSRLELELFKNVKEATNFAKTAYLLDKNNKWYRFQYANLLAEQTAYKEAIQLYQELLDNGDRSRTVYYYLTLLYERDGDYKGMLKTIDQMVKYTNIDEDDVLTTKLNIYQKINDNKSTEKTIKKLIQLNPNEVEMQLLLLEHYQRTKQLNKSEALFTSIPFNLTQKKDEVAYYQSLIIRKDTVRLFQIMDKYYHKNHKEESLLNNLHESLVASFEKYPYIIDLYINRLQKINDNDDIGPKAAEFLVGFHSLKNDEDSTYKYSKIALSKASKDATIHSFVVSTHAQKNEYDSIINISNRFIAIDSQYSMPYYSKGVAFYFKSEKDSVIKYLKKAADKVDSNFNNTFKSDIWGMIGDTYHQLSEYDLSSAAYDTALVYNRNNATVLNNYAYYLSLRNSRLKFASELSEKSLSIREEPSFLDTYGWIQYKLGNYEKAKKMIRKAIDKSAVPSSTLWEHLGDVLLKLNDINKAKAYWNIALESITPDDSAETKERLLSKIKEHE